MHKPRRSLAVSGLFLALGWASLGLPLDSRASPETIKVGILHSLSGSMAISESVLKDVALMAIEEINAKGGVLGKKIEPVVVDPESDVSTFADMAERLIEKDKVAVIFGCWTSLSRKSVVQILERRHGLLFYPVQYEGEELSKHVFYTGSALSPKAILAVDYLMSKAGGGVKRFALIGTDDIYQRATHKILGGYLRDKGVSEADIDEKYIPKDQRNHQVTVSNLRWFSLGGKTAIISTLTGDSNVLFYQELAQQGMQASEIPVLAFFSSEQELRSLDSRSRVGHFAVWSYFMSLKNAINEEFKAKWAFYAKTQKLPGADKPLTNDPMEATYMGVYLWKQAVEQAKSTQADKVRAAMAGQTFKAPSGFVVKMDERNHHLHKPVFIGKVNTEGQFNVVWKTPTLVNSQPWRSYNISNDKKPNVLEP